MSGIIGQFGSPTERGVNNAMLSTDLNEYTEFVTQFDAYDWPGMLQGGYGHWRVHSDNHTGIVAQKKMTSFFDDYYNRIYIVPGALDAGNLLSTQQRHIIVWNAYLIPKTLEAATLGPQTGISMSLPAGVSIPYEIPPLRELDFTVQIDLAGPPTIDSYADFTVEGITYTVPIIGRRIVLFPFGPTWGSPFDETVTMRSWVIESENGDEQTGSESGQVPRRTFEFNVNLRTSLQAQRCENLLFAWQSRFFGVPHWGEESRLDSDLSAGTTTVPFDTLGLSLEPGSLLAIYYDEDKNEIREIDTVEVDGVTVTTGLQYDWPEGSRVYPCFVGLMNDTVSGTRETSKVGRMPVAFDCEPSVTPGNTAANVPALTYRGKELYLGKINWKSALPFSFKSDVQRLDANGGKFVAYSASGFSKFSRRHNWTLFNRADVFGFRQFLGRRQGVAKSTFMPSGNVDFDMAAPILAAEDILVVKKNEYGALAGAHPARRDIIIRLVDGTYFCRRVVTTSDFDVFTRLQLDSSLGVDLDVSDVEQISFLTLYRFESPSTTIRYLTDSKATVDASMIAKTTED